MLVHFPVKVKPMQIMLTKYVMSLESSQQLCEGAMAQLYC